MPGLNRKGPDGEGPMTGRRMGHCNPENKGKTDLGIQQSQMSSREPGQGRGPGMRRGLRKGLRQGGGMRSGRNS